MRTVFTFTALVLGSPSPAADDKEKPTIKEVPTKGLTITFPKMGRATQPTTIKTVEELKKNPVVGASAKEIARQIDFEKESLVVFAWAGSGGDQITASIGAGSDKKPIVYVEYLRGKTLDLRQHVRLLAIPRDLKVVVELGRQRP